MTTFPTNPTPGQITGDLKFQWTGWGWVRYAPQAFIITGVVDGTIATIQNLALSMFGSGVIDTDPTLAAYSNAKLATQRAVKDYVDTRIGVTIEGWDADLDAIKALTTFGIAVRTAANTWALRTMAAPAAGFTITNPAGIAGDPTFALANDLAALEALGSTGFSARTATDTWAQRTLTAPAAGFTITNPAGIAGNPTFVLANDLAALEALAVSGFAARTGSDAWSSRTLQAPAAGVTITNPAGTAGDPTFALANDLAALEALAVSGFAARTGSDAWSSRTLQAPAAGFSITNPAGTAGDPTFVLANDLAALEALGSTGLAVRTASETWAQRTLQAPAAGFSITNPAGVAGDPTFVLANDLAAVEALASTGIAVRTASETWAQRTLQAPAAGFTITNPAGVAGDPTFVLANDLAALEGLSVAGFAARTAADTWASRTLQAGSGIAITNPAGTAGDPTVSAAAGAILQVLQNTYTTSTAISGHIPGDDTPPLVSEGTQILSQAITPAASANKVLCRVALFGTCTATDIITVALFQGSTCIQAFYTRPDAADTTNIVAFEWLDSPATTSPVTYTVRVGSIAGSVYLNGNSGGRLFGGAASATLTLMEVKG